MNSDQSKLAVDGLWCGLRVSIAMSSERVGWIQKWRMIRHVGNPLKGGTTVLASLADVWHSCILPSQSSVQLPAIIRLTRIPLKEPPQHPSRLSFTCRGSDLKYGCHPMSIPISLAILSLSKIDLPSNEWYYSRDPGQSNFFV